MTCDDGCRPSQVKWAVVARRQVRTQSCVCFCIRLSPSSRRADKYFALFKNLLKAHVMTVDARTNSCAAGVQVGKPPLDHVLDFTSLGVRTELCGDVLYIRKCFVQLLALWRAAVNKGKSTGSVPHVAVIGTPGIGKSTFAYYGIHEALVENIDVLYEVVLASGLSIFYLVKRVADDNEVVVYRSDYHAELPIRLHNTWYIGDAVTGHATTGLPVLIVTTPDRAHRSCLDKFIPSHGFWYMPPWSLAEIECLLPYCKDVSPEQAAEAYRKHGGVVRFVLALCDWRGDKLADSLEDIASCTSLDDAIHTDLHGLRGMSQRLVHVVPTPDLTSFEFHFASAYVAAKVAERQI